MTCSVITAVIACSWGCPVCPGPVRRVAMTLPSSVANRETSSTSLAGAIGTGFFVAVLSIPCSGALLGFVLVWAQTQPLTVSSLVLLLMGVGMALPYAVLTSLPAS